jgi:hypothetical protein
MLPASARSRRLDTLEGDWSTSSGAVERPWLVGACGVSYPVAASSSSWGSLPSSRLHDRGSTICDDVVDGLRTLEGLSFFAGPLPFDMPQLCVSHEVLVGFHGLNCFGDAFLLSFETSPLDLNDGVQALLAPHDLAKFNKFKDDVDLLVARVVDDFQQRDHIRVSCFLQNGDFLFDFLFWCAESGEPTLFGESLDDLDSHFPLSF